MQKGWLYAKTALKVDLRHCNADRCRICGSKHNKLLILGSRPSSSRSQPAQPQLASDAHSNGLQVVAQESSPGQSSSLVAQNLGADFVFMATAVINI
ncbi:hypothetical protein A7M48_20120 [Acinetobacter baumannii]|nr:hypothetical protein A7M48_20120 [Acinetobacter baumannii]